MIITLKIDESLCIRSGECYYNHPDLIRMNADGTPHIVTAVIATDRQRVEAEQAIEVCPGRAIALVVS